jgi:hypothetical protein
MAKRNDNGDIRPTRGAGRGRSALEGPPHYSGQRYAPHGQGPTTPRDAKMGDAFVRDSRDEPCGSPSDTPRTPR